MYKMKGYNISFSMNHPKTITSLSAREPIMMIISTKDSIPKARMVLQMRGMEINTLITSLMNL